MVFESVFPALVQALANAAEKGGTGAGLAEVHKAALIFLYRLLFVLYAEDRGLLPVNDSRYDDYGLRQRVRDDVARRMRESDTLLGRGQQLLRPSPQSLPHHRPGRSVHRPAALQRRTLHPGRGAAAGDGAPPRRPSRSRHP